MFAPAKIRGALLACALCIVAVASAQAQFIFRAGPVVLSQPSNGFGLGSFRPLFPPPLSIGLVRPNGYFNRFGSGYFPNSAYISPVTDSGLQSALFTPGYNNLSPFGGPAIQQPALSYPYAGPNPYVDHRLDSMG